MAPLSKNRIAWTYHSDNGNSYRVAAQKAYTDQGVQGGASGAAVATPKPASIKMRRLTVRNATLGLSRVVPIYDTAATLLPAGQTITLNYLKSDGTEDSAVFTSDGNPLPEGHHTVNVTKQTT